MAIAQEVRERMPLAESVFVLWRHICDEAFLESLFQGHRGRSYTREISFPGIVELVAQALLYNRTARRSMQAAQDSGELTASLPAAYAKLRRMPIDLSVAFFNGCQDRLLRLYPAGMPARVPRSLAKMEVLVLDGKTVKWVHKRLKVLRDTKGGVVGGKALVGLWINRGLVAAICCHPDGEANEVRFVGEFLPPLRERLAGPRLFVADAGFCDLKQADRFREQQDHFLLRYHPHVIFTRDESVPLQEGADPDGRRWVQSWGFLGTKADPLHVRVRQIVLERPDEKPLILITDLLAEKTFPAVDLLEAYRQRWGIERVFQQVTEVFGLARLIGTSPQATLFQLTFCLLIYNMIQVIKATVADAQKRPVETLSTEKLFEDIQEQLRVWTYLISPGETTGTLGDFAGASQVQARLGALLGKPWRSRWLKSPPQRRKPPPHKPATRTHTSVFRAIQAQRSQKQKYNPLSQ